MSNLKEQLKADLKAAMISKDNFTRDTIRFLMSAIKQVEVDERRDLSDEDILKIIQKSVKQREDAAIQYKDANREDLYTQESKEAQLLKAYLPKQLDENELEKIIKKIIEENSITSVKEMGKVMGFAMKECQGKADGKRINAIAKNLLS